MSAIPPVRGMSDIPPDAAALWRAAESVAAAIFRLYGYAEIRTPVVERAELFARPLGQHTEVVEKEMYTFNDLSGETLALRPEATASVVRAVAQSPAVRAGVARVWCGGPMFRRERPQKGRQRQFHQLDAEAVGSPSPALDAEQIILLHRLWRELGVGRKLALQINNLGARDERARHRVKLAEYFRRRQHELDPPSRARIETNPLRILDSKDAKTREIVAEAPPLSDELGAESRAHLDQVREKISAAGVAFSQNPLLVRGLDYYNLTVFEWALARDERRQNVLCGGGRYDGLAETIGLPPTPGCGFALGVERLADLMRECEFQSPVPPPEVRMVVENADSSGDADGGQRTEGRGQAGSSDSSGDADGALAERLAARAAERLRDAGIAVVRQVTGGNFSRQMKKAAAAESPVLAIVGRDEARAGRIVFKRLSDGRRCESEAGDAAAAARTLLEMETLETETS